MIKNNKTCYIKNVISKFHLELELVGRTDVCVYIYICILCIHMYDLLQRIHLDDYGGWLNKSRYIGQAIRKGI